MDINEEIIAHYKANGDYPKFKQSESLSYDMIRGPLTLYSYGRLRNWQDAEDAVQSAYLHALTYPPKGEGHNFGGLFKLYLDQAISLIQLKDLKRSHVEEDEMVSGTKDESLIDKAPSPSINPDLAIDLVEQTDMIMEMSNILAPKKKRIVRLALIFGYSHKEIQAITDSNFKYVANTLMLFRAKIKENPKYENLHRGS